MSTTTLRPSTRTARSRSALAFLILEELSPRQQRLMLRQMFRLVPRGQRAAPQFTGAGRLMAETPADRRESAVVERRAMAIVKRREQAARNGGAR